MASKGSISKKNEEMAKRLRNDPYHKPEAVRARKAARFRAFMNNLLNK